MAQTFSAAELKGAAAKRAVEWIEDGMVVGLGSGSTVRPLLDEIAGRRSRGELPNIIGVPTSEDTRSRAIQLGIPLGTLAELPNIDLTIDGADEVDPELRLIKGLGGALLREKIVASASAALLIIVDESKLVSRLGTRSPLPIEVDPFGSAVQKGFLRDLGAEPVLRRMSSGEPFVTDGGHYIFDCRFPRGIADPEQLEQTLRSRPGILENGLFLGMASHVVIATPQGVETRSRAQVGI